jgi:hypothetical protein
MTRAFLLLLISVATVSAQEIKWDNLCAAAHFRALSITAKDGVKVHGRCVYQTGHSITLTAGRGLKTVARDDVDTVRLDNYRQTNCMASVRDSAEASLLLALFSLGSPEFLLGPVFLAGAPTIFVVGSPYCAVHDLVNRLTGSHKITII